MKKQAHFCACFRGRRGIRTPGPVKVNGFQDRRIRPLCHPSILITAFSPFERCKGGDFFWNPQIEAQFFDKKRGDRLAASFK